MVLEIKKFIYRLCLLNPFNRIVLNFIKYFWLPPRKIRDYLRFYGQFTIDVGESKRVVLFTDGHTIENELYWLGLKGWEPLSVAIWKELSKDSETIIDIGAGGGLFSIVGKSFNRTAAVIAFEPMPASFARLKKNVESNHLDIRLENMAAFDEDGDGLIFCAQTVSDNADQASMNPVRNDKIARRQIEIKKMRMATYIENNGIKKIDLIKIDVETYEPKVLRGFGDYIERFKPSLLVEVLNKEVANEISEIFSNLPYSFYRIDERAGLFRVGEIKGGAVDCNYLLVEKSKIVLLKRFCSGAS